MARILITGAFGFLGRHLANGLSARGDQVVGLGHGHWPTADAARWGVSHWHNGSVDMGNLRVLQREVGTPDIIYHLAGGSSVGAAMANPREDFLRTVVGTVELLDWCRIETPGVRVVAVSSAAVYGAGHTGLITEDAATRPVSPYGHHKLIMEAVCRSYAQSFGLSVVTPRLFSLFGPQLKKQLLWDLCTRLTVGEMPLTLGGTGDELRDWVDVHEAVRALELLPTLAGPTSPAINVGTGVGTSVRDIARKLIGAWGAEGDVPRFSGQARPGDPFSLIADPSALRHLGFRWQKPLDVGVAEFVRWFRTEGSPAV